MSLPWGLKYSKEEFKRSLAEKGVEATAEYFGISRKKVLTRMYHYRFWACDFEFKQQPKSSKSKVKGYPAAEGPKSFEGCRNFQLKKCFNWRECYDKECPFHRGGTRVHQIHPVNCYRKQ